MESRTVIRTATTLMLQLAVVVSVAACLSPLSPDDGTDDLLMTDYAQPRGIAPGPPPPLITRQDGVRPGTDGSAASDLPGENP